MRNKLQLHAALMFLSSVLCLTAAVRVDVEKERIFIETSPDQFTQLSDSDRARKALLEPSRLAYIYCDKTDAFAVLLTANENHPDFTLSLFDLQTVNRWIDSPHNNSSPALLKSAKVTCVIGPDLAQLLYEVWTKSVLTALVGDTSPTLGDGTGYSFLVWSKDTGMMGANVSRYAPGTFSGARIEAGLLLKDFVLTREKGGNALSKLKEKLTKLDGE